MDTIAIVSVIMVIAYIYSRSRQHGGVKALFEHSRNAPQHWGTFLALMAGVLLLTYILIRI